MAIEPQLFRSVMSRFATGVTVITYSCDGEAAGMTANAFMSVSLDPPLALVSVRNASYHLARLIQAGRFGVSFLSEEQESLSRHFGGRPPSDSVIDFEHNLGVPLLTGSLGSVVARVSTTHEAGDHMLIIGHVEHLILGDQHRPLVFFGGRYKQISGQNPPFGWFSEDGW